jgi:hypothetical protein
MVAEFSEKKGGSTSLLFRVRLFTRRGSPWPAPQTA